MAAAPARRAWRRRCSERLGAACTSAVKAAEFVASSLGSSGLANARRVHRFICCLLAGWFFGLTGCRTSSEMLEAELRRKERENEQLTQKLRDCECEVRLLEADYERLLREIRSTGKAEIRGLTYLKQITLGRLTGGLDDDPACPGDDALVVIVEPRDLDDQVVKVPGHVRVEVLEIHPQGLKLPLSTWDIPARELRGKWEAPLIGSPGYRLVLRWKVLPHYERLRIVVRFTTLDGQVFETDRDVTIRPPRRDPERCPAPVIRAPGSEPSSEPSHSPSLGIPLRRSVDKPNSDALLVPPRPTPVPSPTPIGIPPPAPAAFPAP